MITQQSQRELLQPRAVSMADVARHSGVSSQTVSRVSNGHTNVDGDTRTRVLTSMRELGYRPNGAARALRSGQFRNIGVIMGTLASLGNMRTLDAIAGSAAEAGYSITLVPVLHSSKREMAGAVTGLSEKAVDGVIVITEVRQLGNVDEELAPGFPAVVIDSGRRNLHPVIDTDQMQGARLATEFLLDLGHHTVRHIAGPPGSYSAERRRESWETTLRDHGRSVHPPIIGDWSAKAGYAAGLEWGADPTVTAIFAANDQMALGVLRALHELDRPVPGSLSLIGFDDMEESENFWPPLTTIHQQFEEVGRSAVAAVLRQIDQGAEAAPPALVPTTLIERASTGPPPV